MAIYKHLRSSTANKRPTTSIADGQLAINTNTASPGLFFKDSAGTGIVKVGPVHVGTTAPNVSPAAGGSSGNYTGEQWLDTSVSPNQMKVWNGSAWVGIVADELPVSKLQDGTAGQIIQTDSAGTGVEWSSTTNLPIGSAGAPAYSFQSDSNTGIYSPGADQLALSTGGTGKVFVAADGKVGIGTGSPVTTLSITTGSANDGITLENWSTPGTNPSTLTFSAINNASIPKRIASIQGVLTSGTPGSEAGDLTFNAAYGASPVERFRITGDGKVGIGTQSPVRKLSVSNGGAEGIEFGPGQTSNVNYEIHYNRSTAAYITKQTEAAQHIFNNATTEVARIDSSGRLLVGTGSSITNALDGGVQIVGTSADAYLTLTRFGGTNASAPAGIVLGRSRSGIKGTNTAVSDGDFLGVVEFTGADGGTNYRSAAQIAAYVDGAVSGGGAADMPGRLVFSTTADGSATPTERMRITNNGEVKIGTSLVQRYNSVDVGFFSYDPGTGAGTDGQVVVICRGNDGAGTFQGVGLTRAATSWGTYSDERLKTDLVAIDHGLDKVASLRSVTGRYIVDEPGTSRSFLIAQDVQQVLPEAVGAEDPDKLSLRYTEVIPLLVAALKESKQRIETLEAKVAALESA